MKKIIIILLPFLMLCACTVVNENPYEGSLCKLTVQPVYPEEFDTLARAGVKVTAVNIKLSHSYTVLTDDAGYAEFTLPTGLYRISFADRSGENLFNAANDRYLLSEASQTLTLTLKHSKAGSLVLKEIYSAGCLKLPAEGNYQADQYVIIHNNDVDVQYLDGLCMGSLNPYNSTGANPFLVDGNLPDYIPVTDAIWQFPGSGTTYPLAPGEDAVLVVRGAIDHTVSYPLSVNLNKSGYFVMYNAMYFTNKNFNPVPGNNITEDHILNVVTKLNNTITATMMSNASPAVVLYRAKGTTITEYIQQEGTIIPVPGSTNGAKVFACPLDWVVDAVEIFDGRSTTNKKRIPDTLDAGAAYISGVYLGHSMMRKVDEEISAANGYEVLQDTNNSEADFYETEKQSLHE